LGHGQYFIHRQKESGDTLKQETETICFVGKKKKKKNLENYGHAKEMSVESICENKKDISQQRVPLSAV
jgi:hypothetical protein